MAIKRRGRTFQVREPFQDPYKNRVWMPGDQVEESYLMETGWKQSDIDRAVGNLLVPLLMPAPLEKTKEFGGETAEEVNDG